MAEVVPHRSSFLLLSYSFLGALAGDNGNEKVGLTVSQKGVWLKGTWHYGPSKPSDVALMALRWQGRPSLRPSYVCLQIHHFATPRPAWFRGLQGPHAAEMMLP